MQIIVVEEPSKELSEDFGPGDALAYIKAVHAARGMQAATTLCDKATSGMTKLSYTAKSPGAPWYPPNKREWMCLECDEALRSP
jgi:hypothetical protein